LVSIHRYGQQFSGWQGSHAPEQLNHDLARVLRRGMTQVETDHLRP